MFATPLSIAAALPEAVDLRNAMPPVYNQGRIGSCVSNAVAAIVQYVRKKNRQGPDFVPSRLFLYYNGRVLENSVASDPGLMLQDAITVATDLGVCPEAEWPYDDTPLCDNDDPKTGCAKGQWPASSRNPVRPQKKVYRNAYLYRTIAARPVPQRLEEMKGCLADGYPFAFGFTIYESFFESPSTTPPSTAPRKIVPTPTLSELPVGQHAVVAVGYDDRKKLFICRNSWDVKDSAGREMQDRGHFYMPFDYLLNSDLSGDFYTIRALTGFR